MSEMKKAKSIPQLNQLAKKRDSLLGRLNNCKYLLRGTIIERGNICGKSGCKCKREHNPALHGPYKYLSHRSKAKTNMIFLTKKKLSYAVKGVEQYQGLIKLIYQISEINFEILRYHHKKL